MNRILNRILNARFVQRLLSRFLLPTLAHSRAYWQNSLQPRERAALSSLGAILTVALFYLIIWNPLNNFVTESRLDRDQQLALLQYMRSTEQDQTHRKQRHQGHCNRPVNVD